MISNIKRHRQLRIKQEVLFHKFIKFHNEHIHLSKLENPNPFLDSYKKANKDVEEIEKLLPSWYFILSDIFGGASCIKKMSHKQLLKETYPDSIQ